MRPAFRLFARPSLAAIALAAASLTAVQAQTPAPSAPAPAAPKAAAAEPGPDTVIARVDGQPITMRDLTAAAEDLGQQLPEQLTPEQRRDYLVNYLTDLKIAAKAATGEKLQDTPEFKARLAYLSDKALVDQYLEQAAKKAVTEEGMRKLYDETMKNAAPEMEARARHILVESEDEAKKIYERVTTGKEDFAKVAAELSKDPGSGKEGGDLGYFTKDRMVPEFADAAFKLEPGQISQPVKSQFGWHVIKLEDKRAKPAPPFEQVKPQIEQYMTRKAHTELIMALRAKSKVERLDKPAAPPAPATPPAAPAAPAAPPK
ncbi:MAG: peptidylprolyl isomerase [Rhizobiales bacterium 65-9]|nr:peptidylprolyl isomerase [Hyphomicrobiales bacterium]OJY34673.1 MAG: peptidylprolyl isomerase [Rhizobiales bacterium 65-9]